MFAIWKIFNVCPIGVLTILGLLSIAKETPHISLIWNIGKKPRQLCVNSGCSITDWCAFFAIVWASDCDAIKHYSVCRMRILESVLSAAAANLWNAATINPKRSLSRAAAVVFQEWNLFFLCPEIKSASFLRTLNAAAAIQGKQRQSVTRKKKFGTRTQKKQIKIHFLFCLGYLGKQNSSKGVNNF